MMELQISFSSVLQIISLVFMGGGIAAWVKHSINTSMEHDKTQDVQIKELHEQCDTVKSSIRDIKHESITKKEAYDAFVSQKVMDLHLKNLERTMNEIKNMVEKIHSKRNNDQ